MPDFPPPINQVKAERLRQISQSAFGEIVKEFNSKAFLGPSKLQQGDRIKKQNGCSSCFKSEEQPLTAKERKEKFEKIIAYLSRDVTEIQGPLKRAVPQCATRHRVTEVLCGIILNQDTMARDLFNGICCCCACQPTKPTFYPEAAYNKFSRANCMFAFNALGLCCIVPICACGIPYVGASNVLWASLATAGLGAFMTNLFAGCSTYFLGDFGDLKTSTSISLKNGFDELGEDIKEELEQIVGIEDDEARTAQLIEFYDRLCHLLHSYSLLIEGFVNIGFTADEAEQILVQYGVELAKASKQVHNYLYGEEEGLQAELEEEPLEGEVEEMSRFSQLCISTADLFCCCFKK